MLDFELLDIRVAKGFGSQGDTCGCKYVITLALPEGFDPDKDAESFEQSLLVSESPSFQMLVTCVSFYTKQCTLFCAGMAADNSMSVPDKFVTRLQVGCSW